MNGFLRSLTSTCSLRHFAKVELLLYVLFTTLGCATKPAISPVEVSSPKPAASALVERGAPLNFTLDAVDRREVMPSASGLLRGKVAIVMVVASFDYLSLALLRSLGPSLAKLPADTVCMLVAKQPLRDRALVKGFFDAVDTPCIQTIADTSRPRSGDLAKVTVVPSTLVLRPDGTVASVLVGVMTEEQLSVELAKVR